MVRLIGAAVNEPDRPRGHRAAELVVLVKMISPQTLCYRPAALDKPVGDCKTADITKMEETMNIDRRQLALPALALGLLAAVPGLAFAGADEDAVAKNVEAFRVAQAAGNAEGLASLCADDMSYSHSNAKVDTKASLLDGVAKANYKWTSLAYKDPTIRVVGPAAIVRFTFVGEQEFNDGKKTPQNLHILMNWQKQGSDWKLLSRSATKL
jgi:ketosteroid isomerase-like protein